MAAEGMRRILAFADTQCSWHIEQCSLAEYCAFVARDVVAHIELAAEARAKEGQRALGEEADGDSISCMRAEKLPCHVSL